MEIAAEVSSWITSIDASDGDGAETILSYTLFGGDGSGMARKVCGNTGIVSFSSFIFRRAWESCGAIWPVQKKAV
jgi:hypothetical protein